MICRASSFLHDCWRGWVTDASLVGDSGSSFSPPGRPWDSHFFRTATYGYTAGEALASDDVDREDVFWRRGELSIGPLPRFVDARLRLPSERSLLMGIQTERRFKTCFSRQDRSGLSARARSASAVTSEMTGVGYDNSSSKI